MADGGPDSWNLGGLGTISLGGSQSEAEISDEDDNDDEEDDDFNDNLPLPPMSSAASPDINQGTINNS